MDKNMKSERRTIVLGTSSKESSPQTPKPNRYSSPRDPCSYISHVVSRIGHPVYTLTDITHSPIIQPIRKCYLTNYILATGVLILVPLLDSTYRIHNLNPEAYATYLHGTFG